MEKNRITFEVLVHGRPAREYRHEGHAYVEGRKGSQFTLRIRNNSAERVLAVPTVDGLSVMSGKVGTYDSGGYVLRPYGSLDIPGWRIDNDAVARFYFAEKEEAYAALMDKATNIGVIGCAVFQEKRRLYTPKLPIYPETLFRRPTRYGGCDLGDDLMRSSEKTLGGDAPKSIGNIGTGFGAKTEHRVTPIEFDREPYPMCVLEIHYDDRDGLEARGVDLRERPEVTGANPFPGEHATGCTPPSNWRG